MLLGGSSANTACALAGLGAVVAFWGKVGGDLFGDFVMQEMHNRGIDIKHLLQDTSINTGACIALSYPEDRALISYMGSIAALKLEDLPLDQIRNHDHIHSGSIYIQQGLQPDFGKLFKTAKQARLTTSLDSGWDPKNRWEVDLKTVLPYIDVFIPNSVEAMQITRTGSVAEAAAELSQYGSMVVIKCGKDGALARKGDQVWESPAFEVNSLETTGAGDCFNAGLLFALFQERQPLPVAMHFANACGAIGASTPGASSSIKSPAQIHEFIHERTKHNE